MIYCRIPHCSIIPTLHGGRPWPRGFSRGHSSWPQAAHHPVHYQSGKLFSLSIASFKNWIPAGSCLIGWTKLMNPQIEYVHKHWVAYSVQNPQGEENITFFQVYCQVSSDQSNLWKVLMIISSDFSSTLESGRAFQ